MKLKKCKSNKNGQQKISTIQGSAEGPSPLGALGGAEGGGVGSAVGGVVGGAMSGAATAFGSLTPSAMSGDACARSCCFRVCVSLRRLGDGGGSMQKVLGLCRHPSDGGRSKVEGRRFYRVRGR